MIVLDASAMLALLFDETGADTVRDHARSEDAVAMSAANYAEVLQKVRQRGGLVAEARSAIDALLEVEPVTEADASLRGAALAERRRLVASGPALPRPGAAIGWRRVRDRRGLEWAPPGPRR